MPKVETMEFLEDFLQAQTITDSKAFVYLKCDESEALILRMMLKEYFEGESDILIGTFLSKFFEQDYTKNLWVLPKIRNLIDLGWINQSSYDFLESKECLLELYNERVKLSSSFFTLMEGRTESNLPKISSYSNDLEYLQDQFMRIDILYKISTSKSPSAFFNTLKSLNDRIKARLKLTTKRIPIIKLLKSQGLNQKEQTLFFAVLKEEYSNKDTELLRDTGVLLGLISNNEYERMRNSALLNENAKLISSGLLDYDEYISNVGNITRSFFIPQEILHEITQGARSTRNTKISLETLVKNQDIFELLEPKQGLDSVILHTSTKEILHHLLAQMDTRVIKLLKQWGVKSKRSIEAKILFFGPPGTGKTLSAMALAKDLKKQVLSFDCSKILSMYVGESEKNVRKIFDTYKDICKKIKNEPILLLDEADQFLSSRGSTTSSADKMHNQMQNIFLEQIEHFDGVIIATTNLIENFDSAFSRRFNYKIEFKRPDISQRSKLWKSLLPRNIKYADSKESIIKALSGYDLSGGQIKLVITNTAYKVAARENLLFSLNDFEEEIKKEQSGNFDGSKNMGFIRR